MIGGCDGLGCVLVIRVRMSGERVSWWGVVVETEG